VVDVGKATESNPVDGEQSRCHWPDDLNVDDATFAGADDPEQIMNASASQAVEVNGAADVC